MPLGIRRARVGEFVGVYVGRYRHNDSFGLSDAADDEMFWCFNKYSAM